MITTSTLAMASRSATSAIVASKCAMRLASLGRRSTHRLKVRWVSRSTVATVRPSAAAIVAKFRTVVLFATPPLVLATTIFFGLLILSTCQTVRDSVKSVTALGMRSAIQTGLRKSIFENARNSVARATRFSDCERQLGGGKLPACRNYWDAVGDRHPGCGDAKLPARAGTIAKHCQGRDSPQRQLEKTAGPARSQGHSHLPPRCSQGTAAAVDWVQDQDPSGRAARTICRSRACAFNVGCGANRRSRLEAGGIEISSLNGNSSETRRRQPTQNASPSPYGGSVTTACTDKFGMARSRSKA